MVKKFIMLAGFSFAVTSFVFQYTKKIYILAAVFVGVYLSLWLLLELERYIRDSDGNLLNKFFYIFGKTTDEYIVEYSEAFYEYISKNEMKYSKDLEIKSRIKDLRIYEDKFFWSSYSPYISVNAKYDDQKLSNLTSKNQWSTFEINLGRRYKRKELVKTGFEIEGLKDDLGIAKPFLSLRSDKKIKERIMTVIIPKELNPINAKFEIYKTDETGTVIKSESLAYDEKIRGFSVKIPYPRRGWTYTIVWSWGEQ